MSKRLYELKLDALKLLERIEAEIEETGEASAESIAAWQKADAAVGEKIGNIARFILDIEATAEAVALEQKRLAARKRSLESTRESLIKLLECHLGDDGQYNDGVVKVSWRTNAPSVEITDELAVPDLFCEFERTVSKKQLMEHLKSGGTCDGAKLVRRKNIWVR